MRKGLVIGKFWPPHNGHLQLIDHLERECDKVYVVVCAAPGQIPSGERRAVWLQSIVPSAEVIVVDDFCASHHPEPCPHECSALWARRVERLGIGPISVVATGETYGPLFASELKAQHLEVKREPETGLSSTAIRRDLSGNWIRIPRPVREGLFRKLVVLGAESTGTSTLAFDLARRLSAPIASEAGRTMSWALFAHSDSMESIEWTVEHFWRIIDAQIALEHLAIGAVVDDPPSDIGPWLVCDTDLLATVAWWERYLPIPSDVVRQFADTRLADLYVVTSPSGINFDDSDPLRDGRLVRAHMHERFLELVGASGRPWIEVSGSRVERVEQVLQAIREHEIQNPRWVHH